MDAAETDIQIPQSPPLAGQRVSFTGTLASMTHKQAQARVVENGGIATDHVSRQTTMLVVGEEGWPLEPDGMPSVKLQQAERWRAEGLDVRIVRESDWLSFVGLDGHRREVERLYTPAMLSQMLGLAVGTIRRWERLGLIQPVSRVFRLPYFDVREVSGARRLSELVEAGVSVAEIQSGLDRLKLWLGDIARPLAQLEILSQNQPVVYRDAEGRLKTVTGQRLFDFDPPAGDDSPAATVPFAPLTPNREHWGAPEWFEEGRRRADAGDLAAAVEALRMSLMEDPDAPEVQFHLAEALYRLDNPRGALERYHAAAELDHNYIEAWTQIGCLHAELGEPDIAIDALRVALDVHADYPDAHLHLAEVLYQAGRADEAVPHWRKYLDFDHRGPWADAARARLEEVAGTATPLSRCTTPYDARQCTEFTENNECRAVT